MNKKISEMLRTFVLLSEAKGREYGSPVQVFMRAMGAGFQHPLPFWFSLKFSLMNCRLNNRNDYQDLFDFFYGTYGIILTIEEMDEIIREAANAVVSLGWSR